MFGIMSFILLYFIYFSLNFWDLSLCDLHFHYLGGVFILLIWKMYIFVLVVVFKTILWYDSFNLLGLDSFYWFLTWSMRGLMSFFPSPSFLSLSPYLFMFITVKLNLSALNCTFHPRNKWREQYFFFIFLSSWHICLILVLYFPYCYFNTSLVSVCICALLAISRSFVWSFNFFPFSFLNIVNNISFLFVVMVS